jgi:Zn-dependent peptidase ImmA (M78 family)/transcriptional regulator with XRE-family HTH domain
MFNPICLTLARKRRGMKKKDLAELINISERSISAYEKGDQQPEAQSLTKIADALDFPESFFLTADPEELTPDIASFRSMTKMTARQRDVALGAGAIALMLNEWIESKFNLPPHDLPDLGREPGSFTLLLESSTGDEGTPFPTPASANEPEAAAEALRSQWGLGELPVKNMITLLESKGIRVYSLAIDAKEVDAFSMWYGGKPFVFLNTYKSAEHCRFDAAHELGHLVLHRHGQSHGPELEREANAFASAFLMPRKSILSHAPKAATIPALVRHKKYWNVSVAALNYRMHSLGLTTDWTYRTLCIQLGEKGYRKEEPEGSPHEKSIVLEKVFSALREDGISKQSVASELHISPDEINSLTFGLMLNVLRGGKVSDSQTPTKKPSLSLIK